MHKALSYGSALQAYALQQKIQDMGYYVELIDYQYPNKMHMIKKNGIRNYIVKISFLLIQIVWGLPMLRKKRKFTKFYKTYYNLSRYYPTADALTQVPPDYDLYITGSDQVWNAKFTKQDISFLLGFVGNDKPKISYAASFSSSLFPDEYKTLYAKYLSQYNAISVREKSGVNIVNQLVGREALHVCDPTLLLTKHEWDKLIDKPSIRIKQPYVLVFMLCYSFNPYPEARRIIHYIQRKLGIETIYLEGRKHDIFEPNSKIIKAAGPNDFLCLVKNADYVITDSFHGSVFSAIFEKPLTAIIDNGNSDSRINNFLIEIGSKECAVHYSDNPQDMRLGVIPTKKSVEHLRTNSSCILKDMLENVI